MNILANKGRFTGFQENAVALVEKQGSGTNMLEPYFHEVYVYDRLTPAQINTYFAGE